MNEGTKLAYTIPQACEVSGIGRTRLYELIAERKLDARACGGRTLVTAASLAGYIASLPPAPIRTKVTP